MKLPPLAYGTEFLIKATDYSLSGPIYCYGIGKKINKRYIDSINVKVYGKFNRNVLMKFIDGV